MRAVLCKAFGPPEGLELGELPSKPLTPGRVRIAVFAAGVNFPDVLMIQGKYQFKPPFPFVPGSEVAGDVVEVAPDVTAFKRGDRVLAMLGSGGFAEEVVAPATSCKLLPENMDYTTGAAFSMTYGTSYYALVQRGRLTAGEVLLVHGGAGGVGTAAIDIGRNLGAKVIATGGDDAKLERVARHYNVDHVINYRTETNWKDRVKEITLAQGADVIYDAVGGSMLEGSLRCVAWDGRILVVGFASGEIPRVPANLVLLKSSSLVGVFWGAWAAREPETNAKNFATLFAWHTAGKLRPLVSHAFSLADTKDALNAIINREVIGKCVITMGRTV